ncbi:MAG: AmmeMemoRadiSam system protein A [Thermodesulfobacteriota bacterium]
MALSKEDKDLLLRIARKHIFTCLRGGEPPEFNITSGALSEKGMGAFVSLHIGKELRGCIGSFGSPTPLFETISDMAVAAATTDPRFEPLTPSELMAVVIEISVLTPMKKIDDVSEVEVGRHGLYIVKGDKKGVLLPQVATEQGWVRNEFLDHTCVKAGMEPGDWKEDGAEIYTFEADIIKEERKSV